MKLIPIATAALAASGLILAGCTSAAQIHLENFNTQGVPQDSFGVGELPLLVIETRVRSEMTWRVIRVADGGIVLQHALNPSAHGRLVDYDDWVANVALPDIAVGEYTLELLSKGRLIDHLKFSITGKPATMTYEKAPLRSVMQRSAGPQHFAPELNQLNSLLGLSPRQKDEISRLLTDENAALAQAAPTEMGTIVRKAKADIRVLLTPEQQHLYDNVNGSLPRAIGIEHQRKSRLAELDDTLVLSPEQKDQIARLLAAEADSSAEALPGTGKSQMIEQKMETDIRALLTPEQQQRFDREPKPHSEEIEQRRAAQAFVSEYLKGCPAIISRDGQVADIKSSQGIMQTGPAQESGSFIYVVKGSTRSEVFRVYWKKLHSAPFQILKITAADGEIVPID